MSALFHGEGKLLPEKKNADQWIAKEAPKTCYQKKYEACVAESVSQVGKRMPYGVITYIACLGHEIQSNNARKNYAITVNKQEVELTQRIAITTFLLLAAIAAFDLQFRYFSGTSFLKLKSSIFLNFSICSILVVFGWMSWRLLENLKKGRRSRALLGLVIAALAILGNSLLVRKLLSDQRAAASGVVSRIFIDGSHSAVLKRNIKLEKFFSRSNLPIRSFCLSGESAFRQVFFFDVKGAALPFVVVVRMEPPLEIDAIPKLYGDRDMCIEPEIKL